MTIPVPGVWLRKLRLQKAEGLAAIVQTQAPHPAPLAPNPVFAPPHSPPLAEAGVLVSTKHAAQESSPGRLLPATGVHVSLRCLRPPSPCGRVKSRVPPCMCPASVDPSVPRSGGEGYLCEGTPSLCACTHEHFLTALPLPGRLSPRPRAELSCGSEWSSGPSTPPNPLLLFPLWKKDWAPWLQHRTGQGAQL